MFNINSMVEIEKQALEATYFDLVTVFRNEKVEEGDLTKHIKKEILKDEKCALSIDNGKNIEPKTENTNGTTEIKGNYVLFLSKKIQKGDKLIITRQDGEVINAIAGKPSFHITHYEVSVLIQERA